tara:strand:+ start:325 stop:546 length:222 start_codon:yes stop_codon:yes gene_type:complete
VKKRTPTQTDFSHVTEKAVADCREEQIRNNKVKYVKHMHLKQKSKLIKSNIQEIHIPDPCPQNQNPDKFEIHR